MFGNLTAPKFWSINSYAEAVRILESIEPLRGREAAAPRPFAGPRRSSNPRMVRREGSDVVFRFHHTDVVTWHPDNSYTLRPYASLTTQETMRYLLPRHHYTEYTCRALNIRSTLYNIARGGPVIVKDDRVIAGTQPFIRSSVNRKRANAALREAGYPEFMKYYRTMQDMLPDMHTRYADPRRPEDWVKLLKNKSVWYDICMSPFGDPDYLREAIYTAAVVRDVEYANTLPANRPLNLWTFY